MKIAFFSTKSYDREYFDRHNRSAGHEITYFEAPLNQDTVNLVQGYEAVCVFVNDKIDRATLEKLSEHEIRLVALRCAGFNNVDLESADELGITIVRVPAYSPQAVAEHAVALILTLNRKTHKAYNRVRENNFSLEKLTGFNLSGKTVGVIGTGQIGAAFCRIMLGFDCRVIAYDISESDDLKHAGVIYKPFSDLLPEADIISLHCPLTPETHHLFNKKAFKKMKKGAMLINTGRGALIRTEDAITALKEEKLGFLGMDVYEQEEKLFFRDLSEMILPDDLIGRLMTFHNVLITAHQGFFTREALDQIADVTLQNISDFESGRESGNEVQLQ
ncbi:MAG: 2-hydroxyacid dehydrogenase [Balneolaceae bacterium]